MLIGNASPYLKIDLLLGWNRRATVSCLLTFPLVLLAVSPFAFCYLKTHLKLISIMFIKPNLYSAKTKVAHVVLSQNSA